ncbi:hypothetical protein [Erythrobacter sp. Alg231-14]|uniref:hypothetical protein n=1 Tax=Erythrobacter sp. Alg231-14 TaxID=1922225 RepID=UPI000D55D6E4
MKTSHIYLFGVAIATVALIATAPVAAARSTSVATAETPLQLDGSAGGKTDEEQTAEYESWSSEKQAQYDLWPAETQQYFWTLSPRRQMLFWQLTDQDKIALTAMTGPERDTAWGRIEARAVRPQSSDG